jgi:hypothetical protein
MIQSSQIDEVEQKGFGREYDVQRFLTLHHRHGQTTIAVKLGIASLPSM